MPSEPIPSYTTDAPGVRVHDLRAYLQRAGDHALTTHRHRFWQLIVFRDSTGEHAVDMVAHPYRDGTVVALAPGAVHRFCTPDADGWLVHFAPDHFVRGEEDARQLLQLAALAAEHPLATPAAADHAAFSATLGLLRGELDRPDADADIAQALLRVLVRRYIRWVPAALRSGGLVRFLERVEQRYTRHEPIPDHAAALGMTERALYALTRQAVGRTPGQILTDRLMLEARRLLAHSDTRIAQIAYGLGFSDPGYFTRTFRKQVGVSPRTYRQRIRQG